MLHIFPFIPNLSAFDCSYIYVRTAEIMPVSSFTGSLYEKRATPKNDSYFFHRINSPAEPIGPARGCGADTSMPV